MFIRIRNIDTKPFPSLVCSMRCMASAILPVLAVLFLSGLAPAQTTPDPNASSSKPAKTPTQLPPAKAEPANPQAYTAPLPPPKEGPTEADVGPVLKHFVLASTTDDLADTQNADNASLALREKIAIDKRIKVPLIHDVQNDGNYTGSDNDALRYEITYLNWGAVTRTQMMARRGHYFTITWNNHGPKADFTARFEYRETRSKEIVRTLTQAMPNVSGTVRSYFAVVDQAYLTYGPVVSWRFTILKGDTVVAEEKSFIW